MIKVKQKAITSSGARALRAQQSGLVLIVTLLALMILLLASVALIRSTDTNLQIAGNIALKRDVANQAERAIPQIQNLFAGALSTEISRRTDSATNNYYATIQASNASGIPNVLFTKKTPNITLGDVNIFYVIDRMCLATGMATEQKCSIAGTDAADGGGIEGEVGNYYPAYRITVRATGPKNTVAYLQTTFTNN